MRISRGAALAIFLVSLHQSAFACICRAYRSPCEAYGSAQSVFVGTITKVENVAVLRTIKRLDPLDLQPKEIVSKTSGWRIYINVEKTYKGDPQSEIILARENNSCSSRIDVGAKLLLYAYFDNELGMWMTRSCGWGGYLSNTQDDIRFLEALPGNLGRTRISGRLVRYEHSPDSGLMSEVLAGWKVEIAADGRTIELRTDQEGLYEVYDLPAGEYTITPEISQNLKIGLSDISADAFSANRAENQNSATVNLKEKSCACANFTFDANSQ